MIYYTFKNILWYVENAEDAIEVAKGKLIDYIVDVVDECKCVKMKDGWFLTWMDGNLVRLETIKGDISISLIASLSMEDMRGIAEELHDRQLVEVYGEKKEEASDEQDK